MLLYLLVLGIAFFLSGIRIINQYEKGVKFRFGRFVGILEPGIKWIIPVIEWIQKVDLRVLAIDIPSQEVMTKDNVPVRVNGVVFFKVSEADKAVLEVENYKFAVAQLSQAALRDIIGKNELDVVLAKREELGKEIKDYVDKETDQWGIEVTDVKIKDIELPENMKRAMASQAEAERDRRARIILAEAELQAAQKLKEAANIISETPQALQLRMLQTLQEVSVEKNSTIIFPIPIEILEWLKTKRKG